MVSKFDRFKSIFILILLIAIAFRFYDLGLKPVHHDEAVHAWITYYDITLRGLESYHYDPSYHGPLQYFMNAPIYMFILPDDVNIRVLPALFGIAAVALMYPLRHRIGNNGALVAAFIIAVSPSMVYQSMFARNDMYVVVFTLLVVIGVLHFIDKRSPALWERAALSAITALSFIPVAIFSNFTNALAGMGGEINEIPPVAVFLSLIPLLVLIGFTTYSISLARQKPGKERAKKQQKKKVARPKKISIQWGFIIKVVLMAAIAILIIVLLVSYLSLTEVQQAALSSNLSTYILLMIFISLLSILVLFEDGPEFYLYIAAMALGLSFAAKENTVITIIVFTGYVVLWGSDRLLGWSHRLRKVWNPLGGRKPMPIKEGPLGALFDRKRLRKAALPAVLTFAGVAAILIVFSLIGVISFSFSNPLDMLTTMMFTVAVITIAFLAFYYRNNPSAIRLIFMVTAVFLFVYSIFYSNFFTHPERIGGAFPSMVSHWYEMHSIARIGGPPEFYVSRLLLYEAIAFVGGIAAMIYYAQKRDKFMIFCAVWALVSLFGYSYVQEKVPWLIVHVLLPFIILSGNYIGERFPAWWKLARDTRRHKKKYWTDKSGKVKIPEDRPRARVPGRTTAIAKIVILGIGIFFMIWFSILVNYNHPANPAEPMSQVESSWDLRQTIERIDILIQQYEGVNTTEFFVFYGVDYWPFPYYQINFQSVRYCLDSNRQDPRSADLCANDYGNNINDINLIITDRGRANEVDNLLGDDYFREDMPRYRWCSFDMYHVEGYLSPSWILLREPVEGTCGSYDISFFYRIAGGESVTEEMLQQAWDNRDYEFWAQLYEARWGYPPTDVQPLTEEFLQKVWDARQYDYYTELYEEFYGEEYTGYIPRW